MKRGALPASMVLRTPARWSARALLASAGLCLLLGSRVVAFSREPGRGAGTDGVAEEESLAALDSGSADGVSGAIHGRNWLFRHQETLPGQETLRWWHGVEAAFTYDALAMGALNNHMEEAGMSGEAALSLRWQINADDAPRPLALAVRVRSRDTLGGGLAPSELRGETGALWGYADGFNDSGVEIPELYFQQRFFDDRLMVRYGQMSIDDLLDDHTMRSAKKSFLNQAFSSSPAVGLPGAGLGVVTRWTSPRGWDLTLAASNVESTNLEDETSWRFDADALFEAVQLGYRFKGLQGLPARLQLLGWNADPLPRFAVDTGRGASLTAEQKWSGGWNSYVRYAWSDGGAATASSLFAAGINRAAGNDGQDRLGIAAATGESSAESGHRQHTVEVYYRWQAGRVQITPDFQLNFGDGIGGAGDWVALAGLRAGFAF